MYGYNLMIGNSFDKNAGYVIPETRNWTEIIRIPSIITRTVESDFFRRSIELYERLPVFRLMAVYGFPTINNQLKIVLHSWARNSL